LLQVIKKVYNFCQKKGRDHLENLGTYGMDIKTVLKNSVKCGVDEFGFGYKAVTGS